MSRPTGVSVGEYFKRCGWPWANWYVNRGRMEKDASGARWRKQLRAKSWRRVF